MTPNVEVSGLRGFSHSVRWNDELVNCSYEKLDADGLFARQVSVVLSGIFYLGVIEV
jgi:hypothetical protein